MVTGGPRDVPAGVRATAESPAPAGNHGDGAARWKAALAAHAAAQRRGRHRRAARQPGPGMNRRPPPKPPEGDDAA